MTVETIRRVGLQNATTVIQSGRPRLRILLGILLTVAASVSIANAQSFESDDFSQSGLDLARWSTVDPVGDANFSVANGQLSISIGGGVSHDVWSNGNYAARLMQSVADSDFEVEVKFESTPSERYQLNGILIQQDSTRFLRFDLYSDGSSVHAFSATFTGSSPTVRHDSIVSVGPENYLRVTRTGDQWTLAISSDGSSWTIVADYTFAMNVTSIGPFVGNAGGNPPAYTSVIDYVFNTASPIDPEDGNVGGPDTTPPMISNATASAISDTEIRVSWTTNEPASSIVEYGLTTGYELGSIADPELKTGHETVIAGLTPGNTYELRFSVTDADNNTSTSANFSVDMSAIPIIDVWYGDTQTFGQLGRPQWAANILGNVSDPDGISALSYSLNGAPPKPLSVGPNTNRLAEPGDFNIELRFDELLIGGNTVEITATDNVNLTNTRSIVVNYPGPATWPANYSIDWSTATRISDVAQVVDGRWALEGDTVRTLQLGYDRIIALGDQSTWQNYEVTAELTVNALDPACNIQWCAGGGPILGILMRWPGHHFTGSQPNYGWHPMGALAAFDWRDPGFMSMYRGSDGALVMTDSSASLPLGIKHIFRMRAETLLGSHQYSAKLWQADQPEPVEWNLVLNEPLSATDRGSALLVAHHVDVSIGDVTATALSAPPPDTTPPVISNVLVSAVSETAATITWFTDEPASSLVSYGTTVAYEDGNISGSSLVQQHSLQLTGLTPDTQYHFAVTSTDAAGNSTSSADFVFSTAAQGTGAGIIPDDFTGSLNTDIWTFNDPLGDSGVGTTGTQLVISVPAGTPHDLWTGANHAPRLLQTVADGDFEVEVKFDSAPTAKYQLQGVIVEQDNSNFVRFDFYSDGNQTHLFAASFTNGSPTVHKDVIIQGGAPLYLRVARIGDSWTQHYSYDGETWLAGAAFSKSLVVGTVGVFGGNAGSAPAFTVLVDYFHVLQGSGIPPEPDTTPPTISNLQVSGITESSATITWTTDEPATTEVSYGSTIAYENGTLSDTSLVTSHSITLTDLSADTLYHFEVGSSDGSGNSALSGDATFTTDAPPPPDTIPPILSDIQVSDITAMSATITWTTDEPSNSSVSYGPTTAYGDGTIFDSTLVTAHSITLTGLTADTLYHFQVASADSSANSATSSDSTFTTTVDSGSLSGMQDDEFDGDLNTTLWTFSDPLGDSAVTTTGTHLTISVPAGTSHDLWTNANHAPRLMQNIQDTDFELEVKFDSSIASRYQLQGIVVEQDGNDLVRFDFYSDGAQTHIFAASFVNGGPAFYNDTVITDATPLYMRVARTGNTWTQSYSYDGFNWITAVEFQRSMIAVRAGVFGGNAGPGSSAPAHTTLIDYLRVLQ